MSNYTLTSPVDVTSAGASQIQLYDASGTNSVTLAAPTLTSNVTFPLPSNTPAVGSYFQGTGTSSTWTSAFSYTQTSNNSLPVTFRLSSGAIPATGITIGTTPTLIGYFMYPGNTSPRAPSYGIVTFGTPSSGSGTYRIRINDVTNGNAVITTFLSGVTVFNPPRSAYNASLFTLANLPAGPAVFAVFLYTNTGTAPFYSVHIS